jgi:hypothetical protein
MFILCFFFSKESNSSFNISTVPNETADVSMMNQQPSYGKSINVNNFSNSYSSGINQQASSHFTSSTLPEIAISNASYTDYSSGDNVVQYAATAAVNQSYNESSNFNV